ncbi:MAG TPA: L,D-transpeptidase family protein [Solirubrobacteraceae bacterium]|nr:L,D-transpeptidase family protein [Solirubrobacteraceae bacterium]
MRDRSVILAVSVLAVLFVGAGGLVVYDQAHSDKIAEGVRAGGVEVGGLDRAAAEEKVAESLRARMNEPILVRDGKTTFRLTPRAMGANFNVTQMVDDAIAASRDANIFARTYREVRGETLNEEVPASVRYSRLVLTRFVDRVERRLNRKPQDAKLGFDDNGDFHPIPGRRGVRVDSRRLQNQLDAAIGGLAPATIRVQAAKREPKVKLDDLAKEYDKLLIVQRGSFKLRYYRNLKLVKTYNIAVGQVGFDTPTGLYHIQNKAVDPAWSVPNKPWAGSLAGQVIPGGASNNPLKARWMGIYDGAGIHGTSEDGSIGTAASHGCIRMHIPDVVELYDRVDVNTPVYIA